MTCLLQAGGKEGVWGRPRAGWADALDSSLRSE